MAGRIVFASSKPQFGFAFALRGIALILCMDCLFTMKHMKAHALPSSHTRSRVAHEDTAPSAIYEEHRNCIKQQSHSMVNGVLSSSYLASCKDTAVSPSDSQTHLKFSTISNGSNNATSKSKTIISSEINNRALHIFNAIFFFCLFFYNGFGKLK
jgi:hypothetical protein